MKKAIMVGLALIPMLLFITSCGVPQEEFNRVSSDLAAAQTQIQSLQGDLAKVQPQIQSSQDDKEAAEEKCAQALAYAEYLDILMYKIWEEAGLTPRFAFEGDFEWMIELRNRASDMGDAELSNYLKELEKRNESAMNLLWCHCLDRIEKVLK